MVEFVIKLHNNNKFKEKCFLNKLSINFKTINSKNIIINRSMFYVENNKDIYAIFNMSPAVPNIPFYISSFALLLFMAFLFIFNKQINTLLYLGGVLLCFSLAWTKPFYYLLLKRSLRKNNIKEVLLL